MHEANVAAGILRSVEQVARENNSSRVTSMRLQVGEFTCIQPDMLRFCLEVLAKDTIARNATIYISRIQTRAGCLNCKSEFSIHDIEFRCPRCSSTEIELVSGRELIIESIEVE